jgi:SAM-dependent methyltransferase
MGYFKNKRTEKQFHRCGELDTAWPKLQQWYESPLGMRLAQQETTILSSALTDLFGFHLLQLGRLPADDWLSQSRVSHCSIMDFSADPTTGNKTGFQGLPDALPIQTDSIDVVVLPHTLEFSLTPHNILREVDRVLVPEGHLVMLVFNPRSLWTFWRWSVGWRKRAPWCGRFLSTTRIRDWMALLGFDVSSIHGYFYQPPVQSRRISQRLGFTEGVGKRCWPFLGAANMIVARKRVTTLTPIRPSWRAQVKPVVSPGLVEPFQNKDKHVG